LVVLYHEILSLSPCQNECLRSQESGAVVSLSTRMLQRAMALASCRTCHIGKKAVVRLSSGQSFDSLCCLGAAEGQKSLCQAHAQLQRTVSTRAALYKNTSSERRRSLFSSVFLHRTNAAGRSWLDEKARGRAGCVSMERRLLIACAPAQSARPEAPALVSKNNSDASGGAVIHPCQCVARSLRLAFNCS